jgi:integrase
LRRRKRDGLYRRENDVFAFRYKDKAGRWKEKYTGTTDRQQAKAFKAQFQEDVKDNALPTEMADWRLDKAETWWVEFRKLRIAEKTLNSERYRLQHFGCILANKRLREITNNDLDDYVTARLAGYTFVNEAGEQVKREPVAAWSINKEVLLWSLILRKAKLWRRLAEDYKPLPTRASDIGRALTRDELRHMSEVANTRETWEAAFYGSVLAANTGLRGGEIKKVRLAALELEGRRLKILRQNAKTDSSARWVELNADATEAARRLLIRYQNIVRNLNVEKSADHYLLPFYCSRVTHGVHKGLLGYDPTRPQQYWDTAWASLTDEAGYPRFRFHDLRHTFISHMVERGIPLGVIQAMVGHISARMLRHYTHVTSGATRKAVEALDAEPILTRSLVAPSERAGLVQ